MALEDFLQQPGNEALLSEYQTTKIEYKYFWQAVSKDCPKNTAAWLNVIYPTGEKPHYVLLGFLNKSKNIPGALQQLVENDLATELETLYENAPEVLAALLDSESLTADHGLIKDFPLVIKGLNLLPAAHIGNLLRQLANKDLFEKLESLSQGSSILRYLVWGTGPNDYAKGFIAYFLSCPQEQMDAILTLYLEADGYVIKTIEQNLIDKKIVLQIHQLLVGDKYIGHPLIGVFAGVQQEDRTSWQNKLANNFFVPLRSEPDRLIGLLQHLDSPDLLAALINLCAQYGQTGYGRLQYLLQRTIVDHEPHAIYLSLAKLTYKDANTIVQGLVWVTQSETFVANKLLDFATETKPENLTLFFQYYAEIARSAVMLPLLVESIEASPHAVYPYLCDGNVYIDLLQELQGLDVASRNFLLQSSELENLLPRLQVLSRTQTNDAGYPLLLSGILKIGNTKPDAKAMMEFASSLYTDNHTLKNIALAINALGTPQATRAFITYIHDKKNALNFMGCESLKDGLDKALTLLRGVCSPEGSVLKLFVEQILNKIDSFDIIEGLLFLDGQGKYRFCQALVQALEQSSTSQNIMENLESFKLTGSDPYHFIRLLEKIAPSLEKGTEYFTTLLKESVVARKGMIKDIMESGQLENLFLNIAKESQAGKIFEELAMVKNKSPGLYHGLLLLCTRIQGDDLTEFRNIISAKMINTDVYGDIMGSLSSLQTVGPDQKLDFTRVSRFVREIYNNPNFIEALHMAFDESIKEEAENTVKLIQHIYDKGILIDAIDQLSISEGIIIIRGLFDDTGNVMADFIQTLNQLPLPKCVELLRNLLYRDPTNASYPISLCSKVLRCIRSISNVKVLDGLIADQIILDFEKTIPETCQYAQILMQQPIFMYMLSCKSSEVRQLFLREVFADNQVIHFYLLHDPHVYVPLLQLYRQEGDLERIHAIRKLVLQDPLHEACLRSFIYLPRDPQVKLLMAMVEACLSLDRPVLDRLHECRAAVESIINFKKALLRFASRDNVKLKDIVLLLLHFLRDGIVFSGPNTINPGFDFPSEKFAVVEDAWMNQQFKIAQREVEGVA